MTPAELISRLEATTGARAIRRTIIGLGDLPGYGPHPGWTALAGFVALGAVAGFRAGWRGMFLGAGVMLAIIGPCFLVGANGRGADYERGRSIALLKAEADNGQE